MTRLNRSSVISAALEILENAGVDALTIPALAAKLKIRPPSLYNHIASISDLRRELSILALARLRDYCKAAVAGKSREMAVIAMARSFREFATAHAALYSLSVSVPPSSDKEWTECFVELRNLWLGAFDGYDFDAVQRSFAARTFRSLIHGFVDIEFSGGWLEYVDLNSSFEAALEIVLTGIESGVKKKI